MGLAATRRQDRVVEKIQIFKQALDNIEAEACCKDNGEPLKLPVDVYLMARLEGYAQAELDLTPAVRLNAVDLASHLFQYWSFNASRLAEKEYPVSSFKLKTLVGDMIRSADKAEGLGGQSPDAPARNLWRTEIVPPPSQDQNINRKANCNCRSENWRTCAPCVVPAEVPLPRFIPVLKLPF